MPGDHTVLVLLKILTGVRSVRIVEREIVGRARSSIESRGKGDFVEGKGRDPPRASRFQRS